MRAALPTGLLLLTLGCVRSSEPRNVPADQSPAPLNRMVFLAVLEGLLAQGFPDALLPAVLERDRDGQYVHFVHGCRICDPAVESFRAYAARTEFYAGRRAEPNFYYMRVPEGRIKGLRSGNRSRAVQGLVFDSLQARLKLMRLTPAEKAVWRDRLAELPKCDSCERTLAPLSS